MDDHGLAAASEEFLAGLREQNAEVPEEVAASAERVRELLTAGGRVLVTVRSRASGAHVTVLLAAKKKGDDGRFVSRATIAGRVGIEEADAIFADDPHGEWPDNALGTWYLRNHGIPQDEGNWHPRRNAERNRAWAAEHVLRWALGDFPLADKAEVFVATTCSYCGHKLTDPQSVERGIGPECYGRHTESRAAARQHVLMEDD